MVSRRHNINENTREAASVRGLGRANNSKVASRVRLRVNGDSHSYSSRTEDVAYYA